MSATASTSQGRTSAILQQPLPNATRLYLDRLAREIDARGDGLTEDDLWKARSRLRDIPIETLRLWLTVRITQEPALEANNDVSSINQEPEGRMQPPPLPATRRPSPPGLAAIYKTKRHRSRIETSSSSSHSDSSHENTAPQPLHQQPGQTSERPISVGSSPPAVSPLRSALRKGGVGSSSSVHPGAKKITKRNNHANKLSSNRQAQGLTASEPHVGPKPLSIAGSEAGSEYGSEPASEYGSELEPVASGVRKKPEVNRLSVTNQSVQRGALQAPPPRKVGSTRQVRAPTPFSRSSPMLDSSLEPHSSPEPQPFFEPSASPEPSPLPELCSPPEASAGETCDSTTTIDRDASNNDLAQAIQGFSSDEISDMIGRLYRATAKSFRRRKGVPAERFHPNASHSHAQQIQVWKTRREELIEAAQRRKELVLRNPRRELLKRERTNLQSSLGPYWSRRAGQQDT